MTDDVDMDKRQTCDLCQHNSWATHAVVPLYHDPLSNKPMQPQFQ